MVTMSWKEKKDTAYKLIKIISDRFGGDEDVDEYIKDRVLVYKDDMDSLLSCFTELEKETRGAKNQSNSRSD